MAASLYFVRYSKIRPGIFRISNFKNILRNEVLIEDFYYVRIIFRTSFVCEVGLIDPIYTFIKNNH